MRLIARPRAAFAILAVAVALAAGCDAAAGNRGGPTPSAQPATSPGRTVAATTVAGGSDAAFCALARADGAANLNVFDGESTTPTEERQVLANIDDLTAAAPTAIHPDFVRFDAFEHALSAQNGTLDPTLAQEAGGPELRDSLQNISGYLGQHCGLHA